jgi:hypothetical protein
MIGIRTTGPAAHIYVNLQGREAGGTVDPVAYGGLVADITRVLREANDANPFYNPEGRALFSHVWTRPDTCAQPGFCTDRNIGQDSGDVVALMSVGYNFDGAQAPLVVRLGDTDPSVYSVPNFYGAHGHDSRLRSMSAIFYAAGPSLKQGRTLDRIRTIDIAPTVMEILGVRPAPTVDGRVIPGILRNRQDD